MDKPILLNGISIDDLNARIQEGLKAQISELFSGRESQNPQNEYMTRKELRELLSVSFVTLHDWIKKGRLKAYRIGSRTYFKRSEVEKAFEPINYDGHERA